MAKFVSKKKKRLSLIIGICGAVVLVAVLLALLLTIPTSKPNAKGINYIRIKELPQTKYVVGEEANYDGLVIEAILNNGSSYEVNLDECTITGFSTEKITDYQQITITYNGHTCNYSIIVYEKPLMAQEITSVEFKTLPEKLIYKVGEWIRPQGGVLLVTYSDGSTKEVELKYGNIMNFDSSTVGEYTIQIRYQEDVYVAYTEYTVTITE